MLVCPGLRLAAMTHLLFSRMKSEVVPHTTTLDIREHVLPSGDSIKVASDINCFEEHIWNAAVPSSNFFLRWKFLRTLELNSPSNITFHYVMLFRNGQPRSVFYFQVLKLSPDEIGQILHPVKEEKRVPSFASHWTDWIRITRADKGFRMMICGNCFVSGEFGVGTSSDNTAEDSFNALSETVRYITSFDLSPTKISTILVKDFFSGEGRLPSDELVNGNYHRFRVEPEMIVHLGKEWKSFDDYLNAMSKKYRKRAKDVMKASLPLEVTEFDQNEIERNKKELHALYMNLHARAKFKLAALTEDYFPAMKAEFSLEFRLFVYRLNGKIVAFRSSFATQEHLEAHFIGIDYDFNEEYRIYQRILYDFVREAIGTSVSKLHLGRTASEIKTTVGAVPHDLVCYIRHRNGFHNHLIRPFIGQLKPSEWIPRNPFKE